MPEEAVVLVDDSDVVKPEGYKFESLGLVRDGSESTDKKNVYKKGYHVTEAVALTRNKQPVSIFSRIHSSAEKDYISANAITFEAIREGVQLFEKATYVMDRGYDDNKIFLGLNESGQHYVIRLTAKRKVRYQSLVPCASHSECLPRLYHKTEIIRFKAKRRSPAAFLPIASSKPILTLCPSWKHR